jgi:hypothetical protein
LDFRLDRCEVKSARLALIAAALVLPGIHCSKAVAQTSPPDSSQQPSLPATPSPPDRNEAVVSTGQATAQDPGRPNDNGRDEILVIGDAPDTRQGPGMTQYDVRENLQGETGSAADLLNTLPALSVTSDGEVSVRGRTDVEILVDGRRSAVLNGDSRGTTLQTMPGSAIKSVEVITNPTVAVESGGSTVINLKLKQGASLGPSASISADIDHRRRSRVSLDSYYGWQDVKLDFGASYREDLRLDGAFTTRRYNDPAPGGIALTTILAEYTPTRSRAGNGQGKLRYSASDSTELGGSVNYTRYVASNIVEFRNTDHNVAGNPLGRYTRVRDARLAKDDIDASLYLTKSAIGDDGQLRIEGQYGSGQGRSDRTYSLTTDGATSPVSLTYVGDYSDYSFYRTTADFEGSLNRRLSLKAGVTWESSGERFRNGGAELPLTAPVLSGFVGVPDDFRVARDEVAGYVEAIFRPTDWTIKGGLKWRNATLDLKNGGNPSFLERRFDGIDTSFSLEHDSSQGKLSLSLSRLLQLPEAQQLNPAVIVVDILDRYVGNPALRPQKALRAELEYDTTIEGVKMGTTLYYRGTEDTIANVYELVEGDVIQSSRINAGLSQEYGAEASVSGKLAPKLQFDLSGNVHRVESSFTAFGGAQRDALLTYGAKAALDWSFSDADKLRLDARADGPSLLVQGRRSGSRAVSLVWQHTIDPDLSFTLSAQQFLQNAFIVTDVASPTVETVSRRKNNTSAVQFGIRHKIR